MPRRVHLDLELASTLDLREVGMDVWVKHPSTTLIIVGYAIDNGFAKVFDWGVPGMHGAKYELMRAVLMDAEVHAWNAAFERTVWNHIMVKGGLPALPLEQFHCTMASAANAGLPMSLEDAAEAVGASYVKDKQGHANMLRMARPRAFEADGITPRWWHVESVPKLDALRRYNLADVEAERDISCRIPRMTKRERQIWLIDQRMNDRGLPVDHALLSRLKRITDDEIDRANREIERLTGGAVSTHAQHAKLLQWLQGEGYPKSDLQKNTIKEFVGTPEFYDMTGDGQEVLELRAEVAKTSTAKLTSIFSYAQRDGRARHLVQYGGAVRTLRWAGRGPQIQNFPRPSIKHVARAIDEIMEGMPTEGLRLCFGKPLDVVASCLRGVFQAPKGHKFVVCDFHAIEAIVLAWLAGFDELLDVFRRGEDIYVYTAAGVGSNNRQFGKVLRLALGFGMGASKFLDTAAAAGVLLNMLQSIDAVNRFRNSNRPIVSLWYAYENAAKNAISYPGQQYTVGKVKFRMAKKDGRAANALLIEKPSGGTLIYRDASIEDGRICYWGVHQITRQWRQIDTYGGKLVENVTQSVARDLLADAMIQFDTAYPDTLLTTVHDEILAMSIEAVAPHMLADLRQIMSTPPAWGAGLPLSAAGYIASRYAKA